MKMKMSPKLIDSKFKAFSFVQFTRRSESEIWRLVKEVGIDINLIISFLRGWTRGGFKIALNDILYK